MSHRPPCATGRSLQRHLLFALLLMIGSIAEAQFTTVINVPPDLPPISITSGTQLNISAGGQLGVHFSTFTALGGEVNISGGTIDADFLSRGDAIINVTDGQFSRDFRLHGMSQATISGGVFDRSGSFRLLGQSTLEMSGGEIERQLVGFDDTQAIITGGLLVEPLYLRDRAQAILSGGLFVSADHWMSHQSSLLIEGGDFRIDGVPIDGLTPGETQEVQLERGQYLSATLADGSPFVIHQQFVSGDQTIRLQATPLPAAPAVVTIPSDMPPPALRDGQTLNLGPGGELNSNFVAGWNSTLNVNQGQVGPSLHAFGARIDINGGTIGPNFLAERSTVSIKEGDFSNATFAHGSVVDIAGGSFAEIAITETPFFTLEEAQVEQLRLFSAEARIKSGQIAEAILFGFSNKFTLEGGLLSGSITTMGRGSSDIKIVGGTVAGPITLGHGGGLNIYGGTFTHDIRVERGNDLTIYGTEFVLDQGRGEFEDLNHLLVLNTPYLLDRRSDRLLVTLADGSPFELDLFAAEIPGRDYVDEAARVYLVLVQVPEFATAGLVLLIVPLVALIRSAKVARAASSRLPIRLALFMSLLLPAGMASAQFTTVINLPGDPAPSSLSAGTQLNIHTSGVLPSGSDFIASGGELNLLGGVIDRPLLVRGDAVVNVVEGTVIYGLAASDDSEVNILGGTFPNNYQSNLTNRSTMRIAGGVFHRPLVGGEESTTEITGGLFHNDLLLGDNATAVLSGGVFRQNVVVYFGATLALHGGDFRIDGTTVDGLDLPGSVVELSLSPGQYISGTLADGTPFGFLQKDFSPVPTGRLRLERTLLSDAPPELYLPGDPAPSGLRDGQTLFLGAGGVVPANFLAGWGSRIVMEGGTIGPYAKLMHVGAVISGGTIGGDFRASEGSQVTVTGGDFGTTYFDRSTRAELHGGTFLGATFSQEAEGLVSGGEFHNVGVGDSARLLITGGTFTNRVRVNARGLVEVEGGLLQRALEVRAGGTLEVSGGTFGDSWSTSSQSDLRFVGGEFHLDGEPIAALENIGDALPFNIPTGATLTGILADGTPFHISSDDGDSIAASTLTLERADVPAAAPLYQIFFIPSDRTTLRTGQRIGLSPGGTLGDYFRTEAGARIDVQGGSLGHYFEGDGTKLVVNSGTIGDYFNGFVRTELTLHDGSVGNHGRLSGESHLEMTGGSLGNSFYLQRGSTATIHDGAIGSDFRVIASTITIKGGMFGQGFSVGTPPLPSRGSEGEGSAAPIVVPDVAVAKIHGGQFHNLIVRPQGTATIHGGTFANGLTVTGGTAILFGGEVRMKGVVESAGSLTLHGGVLPHNVSVASGTLNMHGGTIGDRLSVRSLSSLPAGELNVYGGKVGDAWEIGHNAMANFHGGTFGEGARVEGTLTIYGTQFELTTITPRGRDDPLIETVSLTEGLEPGIPYLLDARNTTLTATLSEGSPFELGLFNTPTAGRDFVSGRASLYLVLVQVPEPTTITFALLALIPSSRFRPGRRLLRGGP